MPHSARLSRQVTHRENTRFWDSCLRPSLVHPIPAAGRVWPGEGREKCDWLAHHISTMLIAAHTKMGEGSFLFPRKKSKTKSSRQIFCEPLVDSRSLNMTMAELCWSLFQVSFVLTREATSGLAWCTSCPQRALRRSKKTFASYHHWSRFVKCSPICIKKIQ